MSSGGSNFHLLKGNDETTGEWMSWLGFQAFDDVPEALQKYPQKKGHRKNSSCSHERSYSTHLLCSLLELTFQISSFYFRLLGHISIYRLRCKVKKKTKEKKRLGDRESHFILTDGRWLAGLIGWVKAKSGFDIVFICIIVTCAYFIVIFS